jgi:hypothetical protein
LTSNDNLPDEERRSRHPRDAAALRRIEVDDINQH